MPDEPQLLSLLQSLSFHRMLSAPRREDDEQHRQFMRTHLLASLVSAHVEQSAMVTLWMRPARNAPVYIYVGGPPEFAERGDGDVVNLLFPPGSRGTPAVIGDVIEPFSDEEWAWLRCGGMYDPIYVDEEESARAQRRPFEEYVSHLARQPFVWLIIGEPQTMVDELEDLRLELPSLRRTKEAVGDGHLGLERKEARFRELERARPTGIWSVHILAGAPTAQEARRVAALLCSGADLARLPYILLPGDPCHSIEEAWAQPSSRESRGASPFVATADLMAALIRPPEKELPGIRLVTPPRFDVTGESARDGIPLGTILDENLEEAGPFAVSPGTLNRHAFVCGATGSGKSQTVRALLEQVADAGIPWLVIEPAKAEYAQMAGRLEGRAEVLVIRPGQGDALPGSLNPLEPEEGFPLQTHLDLVRALFLAAFDADEPFPQVLSYALTRCYENLGWDLTLSESRFTPFRPRYPTLGDLQATAKQVVEGIGYGKEVTDNVRGFIDVRVGSLRLGTPGRFFEGGHPLDVGALMRRNVVIEIEDVGNDQDKAFLIGTVLIRMVEYLRVRRGETKGLRHVTVVEEAHRLLKNAAEGSPAAHAVELFAGLLAEIRAYGEGIVVAEQIPSKILPDVVKNTALKVVHRLPARDDRMSVGATMNLTEEQSEYVVTLPPGTAAAFCDGMDRSVLVRLPLGEDRESVRCVSRRIPIAQVRSPGCGYSCQGERACTLQEMRRAAWLIEEDPRIALWVEMIVVAHLTGMYLPTPTDAWRAEIGANPRRLIECAVGQCAQTAIDARYPELIPIFQPEVLVKHVSNVAMRQLDGQPDLCTPDEVRFQAGPYRWRDIRADLEIAQKRGLVGPHAKTERWKRERKLILAGTSVAEQLESLKRQPAYLRQRDPIVHGLAAPSRIQLAVDRLSVKAAWADRLDEALTFLDFSPNNWSQAYIREPVKLG